MNEIALPQGWESWDDIMREALAEAERARELGEVPVGAVVVAADGGIIARACNQPIRWNDPTAHAEILALREAARKMKNYRLENAVLVVTLEPCLMCLGAMIHARISGVVFGTTDPRTGVLQSRMQGASLEFTNHRFPVIGGVLADECGGILKQFFADRRK